MEMQAFFVFIPRGSFVFEGVQVSYWLLVQPKSVSQLDSLVSQIGLRGVFHVGVSTLGQTYA